MKKMQTPNQIINYLNQYNLLHLFNEECLNYLHLFSFKKGEYICEVSHPLLHFFLFVKGKAKACVPLSNGKTSLLCFYGPLKLIGDLELTNNCLTSATIECLEDCYCIGISMEDAKHYLLNDPHFLKFLCRGLGEKLNSISNNSSINLLYPLENRLASYIVGTSSLTSPLYFQDNLTHVSELLGTSYRHLLRVLQSWCQKNVLKKDVQGYVILNLEFLKNLAGDLYV